MTGQTQWGLTPPMSRAHPEASELAQNEALLAELKLQNSFEKQEGIDHRIAILGRLQKIVEKFVLEVGLRKKDELDPSVVERGGGKIYTFGGYRLGVYGPGSDIDTLVVTPRYVSRENFFETFPSVLRDLSPDGAVSSLVAVPDAHVPIIKIVYEGIDVDMVFVSLRVDSVPRDLDLRDPDLVKELDDAELRGINGPPVADEILSLVPQTNTFRFALRTVKLWADRRGVYGNVVGFPGGIAWALMVARVCQLYPYACGAVIVAKFFDYMSKWSWYRPVQLKEIEIDPKRPFIRVWNPKQHQLDPSYHLMPVITPAFPSMCATHNVSQATFLIIKRELLRADRITESIFQGNATWGMLLEKYPFFASGYKHYLSVVTTARSKPVMKSWSGFVNSKLRLLVSGIQESNTGIRLAHPFPGSFYRKHRCPESKFTEVCQGSLSYMVAGDDEPASAKPEKDESAESTGQPDGPADESKGGVIDGSKPESAAAATTGSEEAPKSEAAPGGEGKMVDLYTTTFYIGLGISKGHKSLDISFPVSDFKRICFGSPVYNIEEHFLRIIHTRNYNLPDDVFEKDEKKPERSKKGRRNKSTGGTSKKRSFAQAAMDDPDNKDGKRHRNEPQPATTG